MTPPSDYSSESIYERLFVKRIWLSIWTLSSLIRIFTQSIYPSLTLSGKLWLLLMVCYLRGWVKKTHKPDLNKPGLYNAFLAPGSPCELNIDHTLRQDMAARMTRAVAKDDPSMYSSLKEVAALFDRAQQQVFKLMAGVCFSVFPPLLMLPN
jgi:hypothetical protein